MTDKEIIKALECCVNKFDGWVRYNDGNQIHKVTIADILDVINRQQAEIKTLQERNVVLRGMIDTQKAEIERLQKSIELTKGAKCVYSYDGETLEYCITSPCPIHKTVEQIKSEAIKEFAERLKEKADYYENGQGWEGDIYYADDVDNLVEEMVGDTE